MIILKIHWNNGFRGTGGTLDMSFGLLQEAEEKLKSIVNTKFDAAVHSGDFASIERFFKIFPLIGLHEEGLAKFGKFLSSQVKLYILCLTAYCLSM